MLTRAMLVMLIFLLVGSTCLAEGDAPRNVGYLRMPPIFLRDDKDVPLTTFSVFIPRPHQWRLCTSAAAPESAGFVSNGASVQPNLKLTSLSVGGGAMYGIGRDAALGAMVPWCWTRARSVIGTQPATGDAAGLGGLVLFGKKMLRQGSKGDFLVGTIGLELPTGVDDETFDQRNTVTNAYYANSPGRMPLAWQPSNGALNAHFVLGYLKTVGRTSHELMLAAKFHGRGDEDVKLGSIGIASWNTTYGLTKRSAVAVGLMLRTQGNDSYPNAPAPGVNQTALAGTTTHGTSLFLDPTIRWDATKHITIGLGLRQALIKPDNGAIPRSNLFLILYPKF